MKKVLLMVLALYSLTFAQTVASSEVSGRELYGQTCIKCHGSSGDIEAFGLSRKFNTITKKEIGERLRLFSDKSMQQSGGVSAVMSKQTAKLSKQEIEAVIGYISSFASDGAN